jgi:hypothetical protein
MRIDVVVEYRFLNAFERVAVRTLHPSLRGWSSGKLVTTTSGVGKLRAQAIPIQREAMLDIPLCKTRSPAHLSLFCRKCGPS